jgi:hypothetical protein
MNLKNTSGAFSNKTTLIVSKAQKHCSNINQNAWRYFSLIPIVKTYIELNCPFGTNRILQEKSLISFRTVTQLLFAALHFLVQL